MKLLTWSRKPEDTLADAHGALSSAVAKYDEASMHALTDAGKHMEQVQALAEVIATKQTRIKELNDVSGMARKVRDLIAAI